MGEVDPAFIQDLEHRPKPETIEAEGIPTIDLSPLITNQPDALDRLVTEIGDACEKWGFFQVINHGVELKKRENIFLASREFFALSKEERKKVRRDEVNPLGYYDAENTKNVRDWKEVFDFAVTDPKFIAALHESDDKEFKGLTNQWPDNPPSMREVCEQYGTEIQKLSYKLLELIALSLGLEKNRFHGFFEDQVSFIRLNHYPPCPIPDLALGVGRHKDPGALTVLAQDDVGGLQVKRKTDGEWILVKPNPHAFIINVGDIFQVWSNDKYESVEHRVKVNYNKSRFSVPFFFNPYFYTIVEPLEELLNDHNPAKYKAYNFGEFLTARKQGNFMKLDVENIQISHFKK